MTNAMTLFDLTHTISPGMPVYPGTEPPSLTRANTVERDGFAETLLGMYSHTGTHIDAPAHMLAGGPTLDQLDAGRFVGRACVIDVSTAGAPAIEQAALEAHAHLIDGCRFALLHTGWARYWGQDRYFRGFPILSLEATRWLARRGLSGIGVDAISIDPVGTTDFPNHLEVFRAGMISVENLTGLDRLAGRTFLFSCLPLKLERADGSPVRAVAIVE